MKKSFRCIIENTGTAVPCGDRDQCAARQLERELALRTVVRF